MVYRIVNRLLLVVVTTAVTAILGCGPLTECTVTPVAIEELKSDNRDLDAELADLHERLSTVQAELSARQRDLAEREAKPPVLQAELERLKKASGVTVKPDQEASNKDQQASQ